MKLRTLLLIATALTPLAPAHAGPDGAQVVGGSATVHNPGSANVTVNQFSDKAIINWRMFDIGAGEKATFNQPNSSSIALNRVTGGMGPSQILGSLNANGKVFVVNRDGIIFGPGAVINTAGFLATTSDIRNEDFMAGRFNFQIPGRSDASIVNMGRITATSGGFAALVAPGVRNTGTITADFGSIGLAAGNTFSLDFYGDKLITLGVNDQIASQVKDVATGETLKSLITNTGKLSANGGRVELTAAAARQVVDSVINTSGVIEANSVGLKNGQIVLSAATADTKAGAPRQTVRVSGSLSAAGRTAGSKGGKVVITGENIELVGAGIDASGRAGGGTVMIGGDWGGGKPSRTGVNNQSAALDANAVPNATTVSVDAATAIDASARDSGHGGKVVLWADDRLSFAGMILALGGQQFGNGGFIETSGASVEVGGTINAGRGGTWLLDPANVPVDTTLAATAAGALNAGTNFIIQTGMTPGGGDGDIIFNSGVRIEWNTSATLTLLAFRNIQFNDGASAPVPGNIVNTGAGHLVMRADGTGTGIGTLLMPAFTTSTRINWTNSTGTVTLYYNPSVFGTQDTFTSGNGHIALASPGQLTQYMLVNTAGNLQSIGTNTSTLAGNYALGKNLDMTGFGPFAPIGDMTIGAFTGKFDGLGNTIANLAIAPTSPAAWNIGLFGVTSNTSDIRNLNLSNVDVTANPNVPIVPGPIPTGVQYVGTLVGQSTGTVTNVQVDNLSSVNGVPGAWVVAGGLVGSANGIVDSSSSAAGVSVGTGGSNTFNHAGGLAGRTAAGGDIINSSASGVVTGGGLSYVGGLAGRSSNGSNITGSGATGAVSVGADGFAGGLVGYNESGSTIGGNSTASGNVSATGANAVVGGLVGWNEGGINNAAVTGGALSVGAFNGISAGGLVGRNNGSIANAQSAMNVTVGDSTTSTQENNVGGLVGVNLGSIGSSTASGNVFGGAHSNLGGLVGRNETSATITQSSATGSVTVDPGTGIQNTAGGLVGFNFGSITDSHATGQVAGASSDIFTAANLGGLVGINDIAGTITNSYATGAVVGGANSEAGGLVGTNNGAITDSHATGAVSSLDNIAGGLVAFNTFSGTISNSYATGAVSGGGFNTGGFVGDNLGTISNSFASGNVTDTSAFGGSIGGFAGDNSGTISASRASGNVTGGLASIAGGFAGMNMGTIDAPSVPASTSACAAGASCATGNVTGGLGIGGFAGANFGDITNSFATGTVSANSIVAGGFAAMNFANISGSHARGAVSGGDGSALGGFVALNLLGTIAQSYSLSSVTGTGSVIAGGLAAMNFGTIAQSFAVGPVSAGDGSFVGGLAAFNIGVSGFPGTGSISQSYATGPVTGGAASVVAGLVAQNNGSLDQTYASGLVTAGPGSTTGGLVATDGTNLPPDVLNNPNLPPGALPATGTAANSYWDQTTTGQAQSAGGSPQTTAQLTSGLPSGFDSNTWSSTSGFYPCLNGQCNPAPTPGPPAPAGGNDPPPPPIGNDFNIATLSPQTVITANLIQESMDPKTTDEVINTSPASNTTPGGSSGARPGGGNAGRPPANFVPPVGLGPLPSGMPPLNETRFLANEVVMQLGLNLTRSQVEDIARRNGLEIISSETFGLLGRTVYRFRITGGAAVRSIIGALQAISPNISTQPSYTFRLTEASAAPADTNRQGDSAQYIVTKLRLPEAHAIATGKNVKVAVIDSEIDGQHPDLKGVIAATYDALPSNDQTPHPHGTGMAGAIASHQRLLGVAPGAKLLAIRAFGVSSDGAQGTSMNIVKGLEWAVKEGAQVINMSFAGPRDPILEQAIRSLKDKGVILIAAAGNAGPKSPPLFPGADPNVIAVSATDADDGTYKNANRGKYVAIAAPGVDILVPAPEGGYQLTTGTSVAAAHISGVVAMLLERNGRLSPAEVRSILAASAKKLPQGRNDVGAGLVDPLQALSRAAPKSAEAR